jgi:50S ribosomal protein uL3
MSNGASNVKGILGTKLGMTQVFDDTRAVPVTVIKAGPCVVTQIKSQERDGYDALQLAFGDVRPGRVTKPMQGHYDAYAAEPHRYLVELRTADASSYERGQELRADVFEAGDVVDVVGVSKGKGFSGVMKRHGFHGLKASHGTHRVLRDPEPCVQGHAHGGTAGQRAGHDLEPEGRAGRSRAEPVARQGRRPGPPGRPRDGAVRGQDAGDEGCLTWRRSTSSMRRARSPARATSRPTSSRPR